MDTQANSSLHCAPGHFGFVMLLLNYSSNVFNVKEIEKIINSIFDIHVASRFLLMELVDL